MFDPLFEAWPKLDNITLQDCQESCSHEEPMRRCRAKVYVGTEHDECEFYCMACGAECTLPDDRCLQKINIGVVVNNIRIPEDVIVKGSPVRDAPLLAQAWAYRLVLAYGNVQAIANKDNVSVPRTLLELEKELKIYRDIVGHARNYDWRTSVFRDRFGKTLPVTALPKLIARAERWQAESVEA